MIATLGMAMPAFAGFHHIIAGHQAKVIHYPSKHHPAHVRKVPALPPILKAVERNYAKAGTLLAHFDQITYSSVLQTNKKSSGQIIIERPNKLRWQTLTPDPSLLVSDGRHAWFYTPPFDPSGHGQYSEYPASRIQSKLANALLSGEFSEARDLKIKKLGSNEFLLTPKAGTAGSVSTARIEIDPKKKVITRVQLFHKDGNRADIRLSKIILGRKFGNAVFEFKVPPNTDRIQE